MRNLEHKGFVYLGNLFNISGFNFIPDWIINAYQAGVLFYDSNGELFLKVVGGSTPVRIGDCIVTDSDGVLYVRRMEEF